MKSLASTKADRNNEDSGATEDSNVSDLTSCLGSAGKKILYVMLKKLDQVKNKFSDLLSSKKEEISPIIVEMNSLKHKTSVIENNLDNQNTYERRNTLISSDDALPISTTGKNCVIIIKNLVEDKLRIELPANEINIVHRIGRKNLPLKPLISEALL